jgi:hypothetical protein
MFHHLYFPTNLEPLYFKEAGFKAGLKILDFVT